MDISTIISNVTDDGVKYLQLFLQEYTKIFSETVNPGCQKCLTTYLDRYKNHFKTMENKSNYRLHAKYENIPLEFGSAILVNNGNITDEYAEHILSQGGREHLFAVMPEKKSNKEKPELTIEETKAQLQADYIAAENAVNTLKAEKAHHQKIKSAEAKLVKVKAILDAFIDANELVVKDEINQDKANKIEVVLTEDHFTSAPELHENFKVGDKVLTETGPEGEITIVGLAEETPQ